ncbi:MAG: YwaF family protein [Clostridia bacterium]|nr:YwaF family protein [Clostridia bacterium]
MPKVFGPEHLLFLAVTIAVTTAGLLCAKKFLRTERSRRLLLRCLGAALFVSVLSNRISLSAVKFPGEWIRLIPDSFCGMSSLVLSLSLLFGKKDGHLLHFVWFMALLGGTLTLAYPDFIGQADSVFYMPTITGLLHHAIDVAAVVACLVFGHIRPTFRRWYCQPIGFFAYMTVGAFLISAGGMTDAFYLFEPILPGTPLTVWVMVPIYAALYAATMLGFAAAHGKKTSEAIPRPQA